MKKLLVLFIIFFYITGCRGWRSEKPPIHLNPNMDFQASIKSQENPYLPPDNIVPWGMEEAYVDLGKRNRIIKKSSNGLYTGKLLDGTWVQTIPVDVNYALLKRGQERFNIYCSMCHGSDGSGNGIVMDYGWFKPKPYWEDHIINYSDGEIFNIISNGIRTMPGYSQQIQEEDRWAIVSYVRALQRSNKMNYSELSYELKEKLGQ